jgi:hypothetical protein
MQEIIAMKILWSKMCQNCQLIILSETFIDHWACHYNATDITLILNYNVSLYVEWTRQTSDILAPVADNRLSAKIKAKLPDL